VAASVVALGLPARADQLPTIDSVHPAAIRVNLPGGRTVIDRIAVDVRANAVSWLTLEVRVQRFDTAIVPVDVPAGSRIVGMSIATVDRQAWSSAIRQDAATRAFSSRPKGAVLTWDSTSAGQDHLEIRVAESARIELAIELPPLAALAIDPAGLRIPRIEAAVEGRSDDQWTGRFRPVVLDLHDLPAHVEDDPYPHARAGVALVADGPDRSEPVQFRSTLVPKPNSDKRLIEREMKLSRDRIAHCYEHVAQWRKRPELDGTVNLQFIVAPSGHVASAVAESTFPSEITRCIEEIARAWEFPPPDVTVKVNYPLTFSTD